MVVKSCFRVLVVVLIGVEVKIVVPDPPDPCCSWSAATAASDSMMIFGSSMTASPDKRTIVCCCPELEGRFVLFPDTDGCCCSQRVDDQSMTTSDLLPVGMIS